MLLGDWVRVVPPVVTITIPLIPLIARLLCLLNGACQLASGEGGALTLENLHGQTK